MSTHDDFRSDCWEEGCTELATRRINSIPYCDEHNEIPAMFCEHANENPAQCPCEKNCYCKSHTCKWRSATAVKNSNKLIAWLKQE